MQASNRQRQQDLVLLGGGHTHALVLLRLAQQPLPGVRITLVSESNVSPYSGMLPGLIAGHYQYDDVHVDLRKLCFYAGARFVQASVVGLDVAAQQVLLRDYPTLAFDALSLNIGATPDLTVPGATEFAVPVKPIASFWPRWLQMRECLLRASQPQSIAVVGGGAGSVELALAMAYCLRGGALPHRITLVTRGERLLPGYPPLLLYWLQSRLRQYRIQVRTQFDVAEVSPNGLRGKTGESLSADAIFWCTQARAPAWPARSELSVNDAGFIRIHHTLQSVSHSNIFAVGDCAWIDTDPLPRAGVYAVRQAPILFENLRRRFLQQPLLPYCPQRVFLSLLTAGEKDALGAWGPCAFAGAWVWRWKDHIDRGFMAKLQQLPIAQPLE